MKRPTIRDVATASGVSPATVSFVLNNSPDQTISAATRERVLEAAERLGYTPHGIAKALAEGSSRIVVLNVEPGLPGNYARSYIAGLDDELSRHGYVLLVRHDHTIADDRRVLDAVNPKAILQFGAPYQTEHGLEDAGGGWRDGLAAHAAMQVRYLAGRGHTRIAFGAPSEATPLVAMRMRFSNQTATALGIEPLTLLDVPDDRDAARAAIDGLRTRTPDITAIAALDDATGLRVLGAAADLGLKVPDDLAVIGYDDTGYGEFTTPALTTIHIDAEAHGRVSARQALGLDYADLQMDPGVVLVRQSA